jgi:hypothetical protein
MKRKIADINIGFRMYEEVNRMFGSAKKAAEAMGCERSGVYAWGYGNAPSALSLSRFAALGGDVVYVLTGRKA